MDSRKRSGIRKVWNMKQYVKYHQVREYQTLTECFGEIGQLYSTDTAFTFYERDGKERTISYPDFVNDVYALAHSFCERKMNGKHIAIAGQNSYEWVLVFCAAGLVGCTVIPIDIENSEKEMVRMACHADALYVATDQAFSQAFSVLKIPCIIMNQKTTAAGWSIQYLLEEGRKKKNSKELGLPVADPEDVLAIVYTSGTTNTSKPVVLTQYNIMFNACHTQSLIKAKKKLFDPLPLYHTYSLVCGVLNSITQGNTICLNGNLKTFFRDLKAFQPEVLICVPMILENLLKELHRIQEREGVRAKARKAVERYKRTIIWKWRRRIFEDSKIDQIVGNDLKMITCGGAQMNEKIAEEFQVYGIQVFQGYGITECSPLISSNQNEDNVLESVGRPIPQTRIRFDDGEILVKGPSVFKEYYKNMLLTEECFDHGWYRTGDIGYMDRKGHLYICGRKKNLIVFNSGKKVVPEELEGYIQKIPFVKEVMVYGAVVGEAGDDVMLSAMVCVDEEYMDARDNYQVLDLLQDEINKLNMTLPDYKRILSVKLSETEFKKTAIKKIKRKEAE